MNVLVVEPGRAPYEKEVNGLKEMQAVVGGSIQAIYPYQEPVAIVCNEEGLLLGLPFNRSVGGGYGGVFGAFFVCGLGDGDFCSLTPRGAPVGDAGRPARHAQDPPKAQGAARSKGPGKTGGA